MCGYIERGQCVDAWRGGNVCMHGEGQYMDVWRGTVCACMERGQCVDAWRGVVPMNIIVHKINHLTMLITYFAKSTLFCWTFIRYRCVVLELAMKSLKFLHNTLLIVIFS